MRTRWCLPARTPGAHPRRLRGRSGAAGCGRQLQHQLLPQCSQRPGQLGARGLQPGVCFIPPSLIHVAVYAGGAGWAPPLPPFLPSPVLILRGFQLSWHWKRADAKTNERQNRHCNKCWGERGLFPHADESHLAQLRAVISCHRVLSPDSCQHCTAAPSGLGGQRALQAADLAKVIPLWS